MFSGLLRPVETAGPLAVAVGDAANEAISGTNHPSSRARESALARRLESVVRTELGAGLPRGPARLSVSHTTWERAHPVVVVGAAGVRGVGVDIESVARSIEGKVLDRLASASEQAFGLPGIALWTLKEAAFKALPDNAGHVLPDFQLTQWDGRIGGVTGPQGPQPVALLQAHGYWVALSIIP